MTRRTLEYKAGYEAGYRGHKPMSKAQYTVALKQPEQQWHDYWRGYENGKEDRRNGYEYNDD